MKIPKIEYNVYYFNSKNFIKLNLTHCKGQQIEISIPVIIHDNLDKYNPKSGYYNDVCHKATSKSGTDIILKDRRNEYIENNMILCEEKCDLIDYNYKIERVKCSCEIKINTSPNYDFKFDKKEFFKSFIDIKNLANINIIKCYEIVLNIKNLKNNYGFYIISSVMLLLIISIFIFWFISYKKLKNYLFNLTMISGKNKSMEVQPIIEGKKNLIKKKKNKKKAKKVLKNNDVNYENNLGADNNKIECLNNEKQITQNKEDKSSNRFNISKILKFINDDINNKYSKEFLEQKDFVINSLEYEKAFKLDKRNYFKYYTSLLKDNHPLMFSFYCNNDYNSRIIKIFLFFFSFSSDMTINALFFNDNTMHKIYQDKGKFNFLFQIPQILYSTLISRLIDILIKTLALSQDNIIEFEKENWKYNIKEKYIKTLNIIKIKSISFFALVFIILSFFWYYITCFCGIYVNTQIHLIKDSCISLLTSFIFPFAICLIPGLFRIPTLRMKNPSGKILYKFSIFLQNYLS